MSHKEKIYALEKRVKLLNKALEIACKSVEYSNFCKIDDNPVTYLDFKKDFIEQAKKELKDDFRHEFYKEIRNIANKYWNRLEDDNENLVDYYITPKDLDNIIDEIGGEK